MKSSIRGQVALFVIIAIVVVASIFGALFFRGEKEIIISKEVSPETFIQQCVDASVQDLLPIILEQGGKFSATKTILYQGKSYTYLCHTADYYTSCYNLHPQLEEEIERTLHKELREDIESCFEAARQDHEEKGFSFVTGPLNYEVDLLPGLIEVSIDRRVDLVDSQGSRSFTRFSVSALSSLYDLVGVSREIVNAEAQYCNFEYVGYMLLYPQYTIKQISYQESRLYEVESRKSGETFLFAVRSCALRHGL